MKLKIAKELSLPPEAMTLTSAVLGIRGSGKTNTAVVFSEELLKAGHQIVIIDPLDVWYGLKSSAAGDAPGFPIVVLGGAHGDLPLTATDGAVVADFLATSRTPAILSLRHLRKGEQRRFVADFAEQLYQKKGESGLNTPLLVVIDEASSFVPQSFSGDSARMVGAVEDLVRRGRASGLGVMLIDQRAASVNKDVLTQLELLIAHRHTSPQDRKALQLWVQAHDSGEQEKEFMGTLASLPLGEAWFWSPSWLDLFQRVKVRARETFDSSATPELGKEPPKPREIAQVDLEALREQMGVALEEAKANDPRELRDQVADLKKQLAQRATQPKVETKIERVEVPVLADGEADRLEAQAHDLLALAKDLGNLGGEILSKLNALHAVTAAPKSLPSEPPKAEPSPPVARKAAPKTAATSLKVNGPQQRILNALATFEELGQRDSSRSNIAVWARYSPKSSGYGNNLGALKTEGLLDYPSPGRLSLTDEGRALGRVEVALTSARQLHEAWCARLSGPQGRILLEMTRTYPKSLSRDDLAEALKVSAASSGFNNNIGALKSLGLLDYPKPGFVAATDLLFPKELS